MIETLNKYFKMLQTKKIFLYQTKSNDSLIEIQQTESFFRPDYCKQPNYFGSKSPDCIRFLHQYKANKIEFEINSDLDRIELN